MGLVYVNGEFVDSEKASVSVFDHGYLYGDGIFEGIRAYDGVIFKLDEHLKGFIVWQKLFFSTFL